MSLYAIKTLDRAFPHYHSKGNGINFSFFSMCFALCFMNVYSVNSFYSMMKEIADIYRLMCLKHSSDFLQLFTKPSREGLY